MKFSGTQPACRYELGESLIANINSKAATLAVPMVVQEMRNHSATWRAVPRSCGA